MFSAIGNGFNVSMDELKDIRFGTFLKVLVPQFSLGNNWTELLRSGKGCPYSGSDMILRFYAYEFMKLSLFVPLSSVTILGSRHRSIQFQICELSWLCHTAPVHHTFFFPCKIFNRSLKPSLIVSPDPVSTYGLLSLKFTISAFPSLSLCKPFALTIFNKVASVSCFTAEVER